MSSISSVVSYVFEVEQKGQKSRLHFSHFAGRGMLGVTYADLDFSFKPGEAEYNHEQKNFVSFPTADPSVDIEKRFSINNHNSYFKKHWGVEITFVANIPIYIQGFYKNMPLTKKLPVMCSLL